MARNSPEAIAVLNAYWGYLGYIFSKKQKVFSKAYPNQIYKNSIVVDFFVRKKEKFSDLNFNNL
jgi:hypothetical protein